MDLLEQLCNVPAPSGDEYKMKEFLLKYIHKVKKSWKTQPQIIEGDLLQDCIILKFGKPRTAIFAHMDSVGFTVRYFNQLIPIGSPDAQPGTKLVGKDSKGLIEGDLWFDTENHAHCVFGREIDRGTSLTYKVNFRNGRTYVESAYLDDRLGIYNALKVAEKLKDGVIVFSAYEEHGGGTVPFLAKYIYEEWNVKQALISDITWASDGVALGKGVVISMRDRNIPRRGFIHRIITIADKKKVNYQLEVEGMGSSDGRELQYSPFPFDWCFVGAPQQHAHTPDEKVHKQDIKSMIAIYDALMKEL